MNDDIPIFSSFKEFLLGEEIKAYQCFLMFPTVQPWALMKCQLARTLIKEAYALLATLLACTCFLILLEKCMESTENMWKEAQLVLRKWY